MSLKRFAVMILMVATTLIAGGDVEERQHFVISDRDRTPVYFATAITASGETQSRETYLFEDRSGQRIRIDFFRNYVARQVRAEYRLDDHKPVKVMFDLPGHGMTRTEILKEHRANRELQSSDVAVTIVGPGGQATTLVWDWEADKNRSRQNISSVTDPILTAALQPLGSVLAFPQFAGACSTFGFVTGGGTCVGDPALMIASIRPDCEFDAQFGEPCSQEQKTRAKNQPRDARRRVY